MKCLVLKFHLKLTNLVISFSLKKKKKKNVEEEEEEEEERETINVTLNFYIILFWNYELIPNLLKTIHAR